jgi:hypothetical protein
VLESKKIIWTRHVAHILEMRNAYKILLENPKGRDYLGDLGTYERIIVR